MSDTNTISDHPQQFALSAAPSAGGVVAQLRVRHSAVAWLAEHAQVLVMVQAGRLMVRPESTLDVVDL